MENLVAKRYAKAIMSVDGISLEAVKEQLSAISEAIESSSDVQEFLNSPLVTSAKKFEAVVAPLKESLDPKVLALLELMAEKNRLSLVSDLEAIIAKEVMVESNHFIGSVESSDEIDDSLVKKLEKKLEDFSGKEIELQVKKSDRDGIKVEVSDLGLELNFSKESAKNALIEHIQQAL